MLELLLSPIDPERIHDVGAAVSWHGRFMVIAWGILLPLGVLAARFLKVFPRQNWPIEVQNPWWFILHRVFQYSGLALMLLGLVAIHFPHGDRPGTALHHWFGWSVVSYAALLFFTIWIKGTHGGPTRSTFQAQVGGDHYNMTERRVVFEYVHKGLGYVLILLSVFSILTGLWLANAPVWMWLAQGLAWAVFALLFVVLQRRGWAVDTYQAIWGTDPRHPGNRREPINVGARRGPEASFESTRSIKERMAARSG